MAADPQDIPPEQPDRPHGDPLAPGSASGAGSRLSRRSRRDAAGTMIPARSGRTLIETFVMRLVATAGVIGIGVAIGAIMRSQDSQGWLIGLVVSAVSVILAGLLWSSRRL